MRIVMYSYKGIIVQEHSYSSATRRPAIDGIAEMFYCSIYGYSAQLHFERGYKTEIITVVLLKSLWYRNLNLPPG